jgi:peptidyl-prolyl cis-trans isomerase C
VLLAGGTLGGLLLLATSSVAGGGIPATVAGQPVPTGQLLQGIARCARDAAEVPLRECIERFEAPLWRLDQEAMRRFAPGTPLRAEAERRALAERLIQQLLENPEDEAAIDAYLAVHSSEWKSPQRLRVFRILVATREQAAQLIAELADKPIADFRAAARTHSLDRTSHERGGDLGFVAADGSTYIPTVTVEPALYAAAIQVEEGAFVPVPVAEGPHFAVVWRRGSLPAQELDPPEARAWATSRLREEQAGRKLQLLLAAQPAERHPELLTRLSRSECALFRP